MNRRPVAFHVEFDLPPNATLTQAREYIETALLAECGIRNPDTDPMAHFNRLSLEVRGGRRVLSQ